MRFFGLVARDVDDAGGRQSCYQTESYIEGTPSPSDHRDLVKRTHSNV